MNRLRNSFGLPHTIERPFSIHRIICRSLDHEPRCVVVDDIAGRKVETPEHILSIAYFPA